MLTVRTVIINVMAHEEKYNCCHFDHPRMRIIGSLGRLAVCRSHVELIYLSGGGAVGAARNYKIPSHFLHNLNFVSEI